MAAKARRFRSPPWQTKGAGASGEFLAQPGDIALLIGCCRLRRLEAGYQRRVLCRQVGDFRLTIRHCGARRLQAGSDVGDLRGEFGDFGLAIGPAGLHDFQVAP